MWILYFADVDVMIIAVFSCDPYIIIYENFLKAGKSKQKPFVIIRKGMQCEKSCMQERIMCSGECVMKYMKICLVDETCPEETELYDLADIQKVFGDSTRNTHLLFV